MRRPLLLAVLFFVCLIQLSASSQGLGQSYISAVGNPSFGVNIPLPNGYFNVANGNLHMEIPMATHQQRGALQLNERLVYDSRIWQIVQYNSEYWYPTNVPNSSAGWRFVKGNETGTLGTAASQIQNTSCWNGTYNVPYTLDTVYYNWTDPNGTVHSFAAGSTTGTVPSGCPGYTPGPTATAWSGYATDASGYYATATSNAGTVSVTVKDSLGTQVYPKVIDRFGNFWTNDGNGNLVDDLGRTPVIATTNGSVTYYDVLAPNGPISNNGIRVRYTVTTEQLTIITAFNQNLVSEYQEDANGNSPGTIPAIKSVALPDGSSYQFSYDSYGMIQSMTLPTGGVVSYGWTNFTDSYQNVNRWFSQSTIAGNTTTYTPSVITKCSGNGTGCKESVNVHRPSGDETVYTMTLDNGSWDTNTTIYSGAASANQAKLATVNTYNFSQACTIPGCNGAQNVTKSYETDTLPDANLSSQTETVYASPQTGQLTSLMQWDYYATGSTPSSLPTRQANYGYTNFDVTSETHLDASGNTAASATYTYTTTAKTTSGVVGHGTANAGGPYLTSVVATTNTPINKVPTITASSTYEDTGEVLTTTDADNNPVTTYNYDPTHTFVIEVDKPNTTTFGKTYSHISKASFDPNSGAIVSSDDENSVANNQAYTVKYSYEALAGRPYQVNYPDGGSVTYTYPSSTETDSAVAQSSSVNVTSASIVDTYRRAYQTTAGGITTTQAYDVNGRSYSVTNPQASTASITDGTTSTSYDALDRVSLVTYPGGATATSNIVGNAMTTKDEVGSQRKQTFNAFGELTQILEPDPNTGALTLETDYQHDALGNVICIEQHGNVSGTGCSSPATSDATSAWRVRRFFYNSLSQLMAASVPEHSYWPSLLGHLTCNSGVSGSFWTDCYSYDANGNFVNSTDNRNVTRAYTYDALNRPLIKTSPNGTTQDLSYDGDSFAINAIGRLSHQSNDTNAASSYKYDVMGRVTAELSCRPSNCFGTGYLTTGGTYDLAGNLTSLTYPDGRVVSNGYDTLNRLLSVTYKSWGAQAVGTTYWSSPTYAPPGEITAAQYGNVMQIQASFNSRQSIGSLSYKSPAQTSPPIYFSRTYQWDQNATNLLSESNQINSQSRQYGYDKMNRLTSAVDVTATTAKATGTATISGVEGSTQNCGGPIGEVKSGATPDVSKCIITYDTGNLSITIGSFTASTPYGKSSTSISLATSLKTLLNGSGSPVTASSSGATITITATSAGASGNYSLSYYSDGDFNATFSGATLTGGTTGTPVAGGLNQQYTLDAWGNLSSMGPSTPILNSNSANQVSVYSFDAAGRIFSDGIFQYKYDDDGKLLTSSDGASYVYDALGVRAQVTTSGTSKEYYYFGGQLIATQNPAQGANGWTDMIYAGGRIAEVAGTQTAAPVYAILDHLGSEVGSVGATTTSLDYAPFGQKLSGSNPDSFIFTGLEHDASGLDHAAERQYSSASGRWTIPDPYDGSYSLGDPQSFNRYSYVGNRPRAFTDPSGLYTCGNCGSGGGGAFAGVLALVLFDGVDALFGGLFQSTPQGNAPATHGERQPTLKQRVNPDGTVNSSAIGPDGTPTYMGYSVPGFTFGDPNKAPSKSCTKMARSVGHDIQNLQRVFWQTAGQLDNQGRLPFSGAVMGGINNIWQTIRSLPKLGNGLDPFVDGCTALSCQGQSDTLFSNLLTARPVGKAWTLTYHYVSPLPEPKDGFSFLPHMTVRAQYNAGGCSVNINMDEWLGVFEVNP